MDNISVFMGIIRNRGWVCRSRTRQRANMHIQETYFLHVADRRENQQIKYNYQHRSRIWRRPLRSSHCAFHEKILWVPKCGLLYFLRKSNTACASCTICVICLTAPAIPYYSITDDSCLSMAFHGACRAEGLIEFCRDKSRGIELWDLAS